MSERNEPLSPEIRDLPENFARAVKSMPPKLGLFLLYVTILKYPPQEAARAVGLPPEETQAQLMLARSMLRHLVFERGESRS